MCVFSIGLLFILKCPRYGGQKGKRRFWRGKTSFRKKVFFQHRPVLSLMFLSVPVSLFYAQLESNYRLYLETLFEDFLFILTVYTVCRALLSITMQIPLVKWTEGLNIQTVVSISYVCYAVAAIGFAFSSSIFWLLSTAVLFTAAESMLLNHMQTFVSRLAPDHMRGRYFYFSACTGIFPGQSVLF